MSDLKAHHEKKDVATNRPGYREARWERAVKVYTVNQESKYLLVQNVHALGVTDELVQLFALYGSVEEYRLLDEFPTEPYTDVYWIKFMDINAARVAKKKLDNHSFFGKNLHVCYAPEYETVQDTREKLQLRRRIINIKTKGSSNPTQPTVTQQSNVVGNPQSGKSTSANNEMTFIQQTTSSQSEGVERLSSQHSNTLPQGSLLPFPTLSRPPLERHFSSEASILPLMDTYPSMQPDYCNLSPVNQGWVRNVQKESVDANSSKLSKDDFGRNKEAIVGSITTPALDKTERISLYLSTKTDCLTSEPASNLEKKQDSKMTSKITMTNMPGGSPGSNASGALQQGSETDKIAGFTMLTGDKSVDKSVTAIREQMTKVYTPPTVSDQIKKRKRRRI